MPPMELPCIRCGKPTPRKHKQTGKRLCLECALSNAAQAAREMAAQSGPAWDKWAAVTGGRGRQNITRNSDGRFAQAEPTQQ